MAIYTAGSCARYNVILLRPNNAKSRCPKISAIIISKVMAEYPEAVGSPRPLSQAVLPC